MSLRHIHKRYNYGISNLENQLLQRKEELYEALSSLEEAKENYPQGHLRISRKKGKPQFYRVLQPGDTNGQYLRKDQRDVAAALAQKSYNVETLESIKKEIAAINILIAALNNSPENIYDKLIIERRNLIKPIFMSDNYIKNAWLAETYETDPYYPDEKNKETERGEFVRSKSEQFIANIYYELGIPYRYEARLNLKNGQYKYPDFTILDVRKRKIIYHEHLGLMDKREYMNNSIRKLNLYADNGILQGRNLIVTYETEEIPFNPTSFKRMVKEMMLP